MLLSAFERTCARQRDGNRRVSIVRCDCCGAVRRTLGLSSGPKTIGIWNGSYSSKDSTIVTINANTSFCNLLARCWKKAAARCLVITSYSAAASQARVRVPPPDVAEGRWRFAHAISGQQYERTGEELTGAGLYVSFESWSWHFFQMEQLC